MLQLPSTLGSAVASPLPRSWCSSSPLFCDPPLISRLSQRNPLLRLLLHDAQRNAHQHHSRRSQLADLPSEIQRHPQGRQPRLLLLRHRPVRELRLGLQRAVALQHNGPGRRTFISLRTRFLAHESLQILSNDGSTGLNGYTRYWDTCTSTPFLFNPSIKRLIIYDDAQSSAAKAVSLFAPRLVARV